MYTSINFKTKKQLKAAVKAGTVVAVYQPNGDFTGAHGAVNGQVSLEGPHYPQPHKWYACAEIKDSVIVKILS